MGKKQFGGKQNQNKNGFNKTKNGGVTKPHVNNFNNNANKNTFKGKPSPQNQQQQKKSPYQKPQTPNSNKKVHFGGDKSENTPKSPIVAKQNNVTPINGNNKNFKGKTPSPSGKNDNSNKGDKKHQIPKNVTPVTKEKEVVAESKKGKESPFVKKTTPGTPAAVTKSTPAINTNTPTKKTNYTLTDLKNNKAKIIQVMKERMDEISHKSLYVRPIPRNTTPEELLGLSSDIVAFRVMGGSRRKLQNYGFIEFATVALKENAKKELAGKAIGKVPVNLKDVSNKLAVDNIDYNTIMVVGLSNTVTQKSLELMFLRAESVQLDRYSSKYNFGSALVRFKDADVALECFVNDNGKVLDGKAISLTFFTSPTKKESVEKNEKKAEVKVVESGKPELKRKARELSEAESEPKSQGADVAGTKKVKLSAAVKPIVQEKPVVKSIPKNDEEGSSSEDDDEEDEDSSESMDEGDSSDGDESGDLDSSDEELMKALGSDGDDDEDDSSEDDD